jgi:hypothetical protein
MYHPGDIRPGSVNGILGVASQAHCDATLTADECRELYDYINHLEYTLREVIQQVAKKVGIVVEGEERPEGAPKPTEFSLVLSQERAEFIKGSAMIGRDSPRDQPYWKLAKARRQRERWWAAQEKRYAEAQARFEEESRTG